MKIDISDLLAKMPAVKKMVDEKVLEVTQKVTLDAHRNVVIASPVDTGKFRAAWQVETPTKPYENGEVTNNTEYGPFLVHGHSDQAPPGWFEAAVLAAARSGGK